MHIRLPKIFANQRPDHAVTRSTAAPVPASTSGPTRNETGINSGSSGRQNDAAPAQASRLDRARFFSFFFRNRRLQRRSGEASATRGSDTASRNTNPNIKQARPTTTSSSSANVRSLESYLTVVSKSLDAILQTDWEIHQQRVKDAVNKDSLKGMSDLLYSDPLRNFPMPAKNIVLIAHQFPEERNNPAFAKLLAIATKTGYQPEQEGKKLRDKELSTAIDPVFNPGESLEKYYRARSSAHDAQSSTQALHRDDLPAEEEDFREWAVISELWIIGHELQAGRENIEVLAGAYSAYISSRGDSQGRMG